MKKKLQYIRRNDLPQNLSLQQQVLLVIKKVKKHGLKIKSIIGRNINIIK